METWRKSARHYSTRPLRFVDPSGLVAERTELLLYYIEKDRPQKLSGVRGIGGAFTAGVYGGSIIQFNIVFDSYGNVGTMIFGGVGIVSPQISITGNMLYMPDISIYDLGHVVGQEYSSLGEFMGAAFSGTVGVSVGPPIVGVGLGVDVIHDLYGITGVQISCGWSAAPVSIHYVFGGARVRPLFNVYDVRDNFINKIFSTFSKQNLFSGTTRSKGQKKVCLV